ncbi:TPA: lysis protein, partial [Serratia fonticola]
SLGWDVDRYRNNALTFRKQRDDATQRLAMANTTLTVLQRRQRELSALDKTHTEALNAAEYENDDLRRQLTAGTRRVYIRGKCSVPGTSNQHSPSGVGDDAPVELSGKAGQDILDLRADIIRDNAKLRFLQEYVAEKRR